jgi:DNA-binding transcriptional LysR family regulator
MRAVHRLGLTSYWTAVVDASSLGQMNVAAEVTESELPVPIDLRLLRYFVAVASERNVTRAADRLRISQQALSAAMRRLEEELQAQLLVRSSSGVSLTAAGAALIEEAPRALALVQEVCQRATMTGRGERPALKVAYGWTEGEATVARLWRETRRASEPIEWTPHSLPRSAIRGELLSGAIDAAIMTEPDLVDSLRSVPIRSEPLLAVLGRAHTDAAGRGGLSLDALAGSTLAIVPRGESPTLHRAILGHFRADGAEPATVPLTFSGREAEAAADLYESDWVMLAPASVAAFLRSWGLAPRPLLVPRFVSIHLVWSPAATDVRGLVRAARAISRRLGWLHPDPAPPNLSLTVSAGSPFPVPPIQLV